MSFDKFESRVAAKTQPAEQAAAVAEKARRPFNQAFQEEVYPHWQGPLKQISGKATVTRTGLQVVAGFPEAVNRNDVLAALGRDDFLVSEVVMVNTSQDVHAQVAYAFAGVPARAMMVRVPISIADGKATVHVDLLEKWTSSIEELCKSATADVPAAADMFGVLLDRALDAHEAAEKARVEQADRTRQEALQATKDRATAEAAEAKRQADAAAKTAAEKAEVAKKASADADAAAKKAADKAAEKTKVAES
jgi:hypothetical protein